MPLTFKSRAGASIMMLDAVGKEMLEMLGFGVRIPGAITAEDLPRARDNIQQALEALPEDGVTDTEDDHQSVALKTRALPLLQLIDASIADDEYLRWE